MCSVGYRRFLQLVREDCSESEDFGSVIVVKIKEIDYVFVELVELWLQLLLFLLSLGTMIMQSHLYKLFPSDIVPLRLTQEYRTPLTQLKNF